MFPRQFSAKTAARGSPACGLPQIVLDRRRPPGLVPGFSERNSGGGWVSGLIPAPAARAWGRVGGNPAAWCRLVGDASRRPDTTVDSPWHPLPPNSRGIAAVTQVSAGRCPEPL